MLMMDNLTYAEAIDQLKRLTDALYDQSGGLRDSATLDEKIYWNMARKQAGDLYNTFCQLDSIVSNERGSFKLSFSMDEWKAWVSKRMYWL